MEQVKLLRIKELSETMTSNLTATVCKHDQYSGELKSLITTILEQCDSLLMDFDIKRCNCHNLQQKFEKICVKVIELHKNHDRIVYDLKKLNEVSLVSCNDFHTTCDEFNKSIKINDYKVEDNMNETFTIIEETSQELFTAERIEVINLIEKILSHQSLHYLLGNLLPFEESREKFSNLFNEINILMSTIKELDQIIIGTKSVTLNDELGQMRLKHLIIFKEKYNKLMSKLKKGSLQGIFEVKRDSLISELEKDSLVKNLKNFKDSHIVDKSNLNESKLIGTSKKNINKETESKVSVKRSKTITKSSMIKKYKCSCKKFCVSALCTCRKNGVACDASNCNCDPNFCQNANNKPKKPVIKRTKTFTISS